MSKTDVKYDERQSMWTADEVGDMIVKDYIGMSNRLRIHAMELARDNVMRWKK